MTTNRYQELLAKIDAKALELKEQHGAQITCRKTCHSCCAPQLRVFSVEAEHIRAWLEADPARAQAALANEQADPHEGKRCAFLDAEGACLVYEARPVVCRTHGLPLQFKGQDERVQRDVCPLNFAGEDLAALPPAGVLNLDLINVLLTLIQQERCGPSTDRIVLHPSVLLEGSAVDSAGRQG